MLSMTAPGLAGAAGHFGEGFSAKGTSLERRCVVVYSTSRITRKRQTFPDSGGASSARTCGSLAFLGGA